MHSSSAVMFEFANIEQGCDIVVLILVVLEFLHLDHLRDS